MPVAPEHAGGGPFYLALVDAGETTFGVEHHRYDEYVFSFTLSHSEGDIPTLEMEIKNPRVGFLSTGRKIWVWFAYDSGSGPEPLFFGRLVGIPSDLFKEVVTLQFTARPSDVAEQKAAVADELKELPAYDPIFIDPDKRDDPETVLEGYSRLWHFDRVTHAVTTSDILVGEDGVASFGQGDAFYDSVSMELNAAPQNAVTVIGTVHWTQQATGTIDFGMHFFQKAGGLIEQWPKPGTVLQQGWSVESSRLITYRLNPQPVTWQINYTNREKEHHDGDTLSHSETYSGYPPQTLTVHYTEFVIGDPETGTGARANLEGHGYKSSFPDARAGFVLRYDAKRARSERVTFTLQSDLQAVLRDDGETLETEKIEITGADVGLAFDDVDTDSDGSIPIGDLSRRAYYPTDRGNLSLQHLILRAVARLKLGARVGRVSFETAFDKAINLSLRMNAVLTDYRLPGGQASGKIISYALSGDGDQALFVGKITFAGAVGLANALTFSDGDPIYVDDDYVEDDYQERDGEVIAIGAGNVGYSPPTFDVNDDGVVFPLTRANAIVTEAIHPADITAVTTIEDPDFRTDVNTGPGEQSIRFSERLQAALDFKTILDGQVQNTQSAWYELELKSMTAGPFDDAKELSVTHLTLPKQIDMTAT